MTIDRAAHRPVAEANVARTPPAPTPEAKPVAKQESIPPRRPMVLVVDVDPRNCSALQHHLDQAGYRTTVASCFEDACKALSVEPPDLLLTAVRLGRFNGLYLALLCRSARPQAPVLILGQPEDSGLATDAAQLGARFVCTTTRPSELLGIVAELIQDRQPTNPASATGSAGRLNDWQS